MADLDEKLAGPAESIADAPTPEAIADGGETVDDALEASESDSHLTDEGPATTDDAVALESSEPENADQDGEEDRPVTRRELARKADELDRRLKEALEERDRERQRAEEQQRLLESNQKSQQELEKDFFELVGTEDEFREADRLSRYSDDPYEREEALRKYEQLARMREKLPRAWLWYVGKMAGADVQAFATEAKLDAASLIAAPSMADLLKTVRAQSVADTEKQWQAKYAALQAQLDAEKKAHDAARARAGGTVPSPERGGRPGVGKGPTLDQINAMSWDKRREYLSTSEGKAHYNALTRQLQGVA